MTQHLSVVLLILLIALPLPAQAFTAAGHLQITRSALKYLHAEQSAGKLSGHPIESWMALTEASRSAFETTVIRATIDLDHQPDVWGDDNDQLLAMLFSRVRADLTPALGGCNYYAKPGVQNAEPPEIQDGRGVYRNGFRGKTSDWQKLFFSANNTRDAVMPITAQIFWLRAKCAKRCVTNIIWRSLRAWRF